ncbi:YdiU family protein [Bacterioplanoides sp. SCSIO 12839]|uniref:protein adenylyltransferase SelO n=1 Tax=Bacterioplanoides sp. SCSIO 12839 TaxID=2829569 RepID=UPI002102CD08|nr:protein adenylyltransferase SelO family protein [Bacterioplanoides sp. SCSIO 12839]UTW49843.1 YdiU family protein [Bacterioplanoides sp. SCSIO 12839]
MSSSSSVSDTKLITNFSEFSAQADYSLLENLNINPDAREDGMEHQPRQVFSGHYVPVVPTPIAEPEYIAHSNTLFAELGLDDSLVKDEAFAKIFAADISPVLEAVSQAGFSPMHPYGWATGYALSIYGREYIQQCPFRTGNGYGDGRAMSIFEGVFNGKRWEMQLKGGGRTPYCRGADGRAVLRSSVREFLVQEHMHALGIPTSRSLTLFTSKAETVTRPWYSEQSQTYEPDILVDNPVAISTRVAPSFLRVGQVELFARRTRNKEYDHAAGELKLIVQHLIEREYKDDIDTTLSFPDQVIKLAECFRGRLTALVANWIRVGFCQGNFNSDNCPAGGYTLDYGPFGFCEQFDPQFQPWTGGGEHFSFFNQPAAAEANFHMFWKSVRTLLESEGDDAYVQQLDEVRRGFEKEQRIAIQTMWAAKLGLDSYDEALTTQLLSLMHQSEADYTRFFRELSSVPTSIEPLKQTFYLEDSEHLNEQWQSWLEQWRDTVLENQKEAFVAAKMKQTNPKYTWREWLVVPAYQQAAQGDYSLVKELQQVLTHPYDEQTPEIEAKFYRQKPAEYFHAGGVSHYSCSS